MIDEGLLRKEEKAVFNLRSLYGKYGYLPYKMSKFEEYELYVRNKNFLVSDRIITFNDTNGKLLALKPDVTLSIIKNGEDLKGYKQKVYYNENVYRVSQNTGRFKEIMQTGIECIGEIDIYDIFEAISIAAQTLMQISDSFILGISHLGILSKVLEDAGKGSRFIKQATKLIAEKNTHDLLRLCEKFEVEEKKKNNILLLVSSYGNRKNVIEALEKTECLKGFDEIKELSKMLDRLPYSSKIIFDFSIVNDMNYYNGFVFKGFLDGIFDGVLAGGQYDSMMKKLGRKSGAVGFALYLDSLGQIKSEKSGYDIDVLVLYDEDTDKSLLAQKVEKLISDGKKVSAQREDLGQIRYRKIIDLRKGKK